MLLFLKQTTTTIQGRWNKILKSNKPEKYKNVMKTFTFDFAGKYKIKRKLKWKTNFLLQKFQDEKENLLKVF